MDAPLGLDDDASGNMYEVYNDTENPKPDDHLISQSLGLEIERSLHTLTTREGDVIRLYFGLTGENPLTLEEIGQRFDLTRERVRQIKEKGLRRLKHNSRSQMLRSYLG